MRPRKIKDTSEYTRDKMNKCFCCKFCDYKTSKGTCYRRHLTIHKKDISCSVCQFKCSTQRSLKNHMLVHSGNKYFQCNFCDYVNKQQCLINTHIARTHADVELFKCKFCDFKAVDEHVIEKHTLKYHIQAANGTVCVNEMNKDESDCSYNPESKGKYDIKYPSVVLNRCDDKINDKSPESESTNTHKCIGDTLLKEYSYMSEPGCNPIEKDIVQDDAKKDKGKGRPDYQTTLQLKGGFEMVASIFSDAQDGNSTAKVKRCEVTFRKMDVLPTNVEKLPMFDKKCDEVDRRLTKTFNSEEMSQLENTKVQSISDKSKSNKLQPTCESCNFTFKRQIELIRHNAVKHNNINSFKCTLCDFTCKVHKHLINHLKKHHNSKSFPCGKCTFSRKNIHYLEKHLMSYKRRGLYNCEHCHYSSSCKSIFDIHKFIHSGKTKHNCDTCGFKAATRYRLSRHKKVHFTNEK